MMTDINRLGLFFGVMAILLTPTDWAHAHGGYHEVVLEIAEKLKTAPDDAALRFRLAGAHAEHGEWKSALVEVEHVRRLAPDEFQTGFVSGKALAAGGFQDAALADLSGFLRQQPAHADALVERARVLLKLGRADDAFADYRVALEESAAAELFVEAVEALRLHLRLEESLVVAEAGVRRTRGDPAVLICAVDSAIAVRKIDEAVSYLDDLCKVWPRPEPWMKKKAEALAAFGRAQEARLAWRTLHDHIMALPNLDRAQPFLASLLDDSRKALGIIVPAAVVAPPALAP
jgi:tetratricopeptide (TPR) repeat protein